MLIYPSVLNATKGYSWYYPKRRPYRGVWYYPLIYLVLPSSKPYKVGITNSFWQKLTPSNQINALEDLAGKEVFSHADLALGTYDETWSKYQIREAPVFFESNGSIVPSKYKAVLRNDKLAAIVSRRYTVVPNEEVLKICNESGFSPERVHYSRGKNAMFAELFSERFPDQEVKVGDVVKVGVMLRNSIDCTTSFGMDIFTYRLTCQNGAVARGKSLGSYSRKHLGNRDKLLKGFRENVFNVMEKAQELVQNYRKAIQVKINNQLAQKILAQKVPAKYMPEYVTVERKTQVARVVNTDKNLWNLFNDMTESIWHNKKARMESKVLYEQQLHQILVEETASVR